MVEEGSPAPELELEDDSGSTVRLSDFRGSPVVLYFYLKDASADRIDSNGRAIGAATEV